MANDADDIVKQCAEEYRAGLQYKQGRIKDWQENEDQYFGKVKRTLKSRFNVPLPIMSGFVDTLLSKVDDPPELKYHSDKESEYFAAQKATSLYKADSLRDDTDWQSLDLYGKKHAIMYGRAAYKFYAESDPEYRATLELIDPYDFNIDPMGGADLEKHRFMSQDGIMKSEAELKAGVEMGIYDAQQVAKLTQSADQGETKQTDTDNAYMNKANRYAALGLNNKVYNYAGQQLYRLVEACTTWKGKRYYVVYNLNTKLWIRCEELPDVFKSNLWPFLGWATNPDSWNYYSKAPADDIRPLAESIRILANQELDNRQKSNWGMRAYDPEIFPNPADLEWRPDGLVAVKAGTSKVTQIDKGIYSFQTPQLSGTINLVQYFDNLLGQKTGVTADSQGSSSEDKVGIYYGNMEQVSDRLGLTNRRYAKFYEALGRRHLWGAFEHLNQPQAVKILGPSGATWDEIRKREINTGWNIEVSGGAAEEKANAMKTKQKQDMLTLLLSNPTTATVMNPTWVVEESLKAGGYDDAAVKTALDKGTEPDKIVTVRAAQAIEDIVNGKEPKLFRGATTAFVQKIQDFAADNTDDDMDLFARLMAYAAAHQEYVMKNMVRQAMQQNPQAALQGTPNAPGAPQTGDMPPAVPGTPNGTQAQSQQLSNLSPSV